MSVREALSVCLLNLGFLICHSATDLSMGGSDLFSEGLQSALRSELEAQGIEADLSFEGTLSGLRGLESGSVEACLLALPDTMDPGLKLPSFPLAFQIVAFVVDAGNPVSELSYRQLADLFRFNGPIDKWAGLSGDPLWKDRNVNLVAGRIENTITLELFNALVLNGKRLKSSIRYVGGTDQQLLDAVLEEPRTLLLVPAVALPGNLKHVAIKKSENDQAYTPTSDNIFFGDYSLRLPFRLVVSGDMDQATIGGLLKACFSEPVTRALTEMHCVPLPERERSLILSAFE